MARSVSDPLSTNRLTTSMWPQKSCSEQWCTTLICYVSGCFVCTCFKQQSHGFHTHSAGCRGWMKQLLVSQRNRFCWIQQPSSCRRFPPENNLNTTKWTLTGSGASTLSSVHKTNLQTTTSADLRIHPKQYILISPDTAE